MPRIRDMLVRLHRWAGLVMAGFLVLTGLTGSVLAFQHELDAWLSPELFRVQPAKAPPLDLNALVARLEAQNTEGRVVRIERPDMPNGSVSFEMESRHGPNGFGDRLFFADPATGRILGSRDEAGCCARAQIIPFIYRLHYTLHGGPLWRTLLGWIALIWTIDCFVGFFLTLPRAGPFWRKWRISWSIKPRAAIFRRNLDLHRAGGLWLWPALILLATSSVYFNLRHEVFYPTVGLAGPITPRLLDSLERRELGDTSRIGFGDAMAKANAEAIRLGWMERVRQISYHSDKGVYRAFLGERLPIGFPGPRIHLDARNGTVIEARRAEQGTTADQIIALQHPIHSGALAGLPGRILICLSGLIIAMLSITGIYIWWKKRAPRSGRR